MGDELAAPAAQPTSDASQTPGEQTARPDFATVLSHLDSYLTESPDLRQEFRGSRIAMGIAGEMAQRQREVHEQEAAARAIQAEKERLKSLRTSDPVAYAEEMDAKEALFEKQQELAAVRDTTRREFVESIGESLREMPEFSSLTAPEMDALAAKMKGVPENKVVGAFARAAAELVAEKRAESRIAAANKTAVAEAEKVWKANQRTERLQGRKAPSLGSESGAGRAVDDGDPEPQNYASADWRAWDERQRKAGTGIYNRARYQRAS